VPYSLHPCLLPGFSCFTNHMYEISE
jgi:hypothetical protein